ncbi:interleukin-31 receptor subunit alpha-like [Patagioenas fasciata monilis]|uniref:Interleukin-31 receptor subunit alpha-like n=1 Tax=Patagioenas fasciata monilis TaxID=372326 RepID=A0A1V4L1Z7_PATFA|nr:interleukin-31 receptor subunit alpha-like [Patagioenas fasciata monilis]
MGQSPASVSPAQATTVTPDTLQMLEIQPVENEDLNYLHFRQDSCNRINQDFPLCRQVQDWDNELVCYKELSEDLTCIWLPLPSAPNTINYTIFLKWDRISRPLQRNTSSSYITIERKDLYMERSASIWIVVNYPHGSCVGGKNISVTPSKAGKCLTASNINAYQITNRLIIEWALPATPTPYELRYREAFTESTQWTLVPVESNAVNVTILNVNAASSYVVQLRCIAKDGLHCVCIWSKEILVPHKLTNKPRISYNATTEISPGRRSVLLKWEVTQSENILGYYVNVERTPNSCMGSPNRIFLKDRKVLLNLSMAYYTVNISAYNKAGESPQAIYVVPDFSARDLPGQIRVKNQGTDAVVTWIPEYNPKCFVVDWGTGKEDMRMKIITTATGNFTLDNFQPYKLYKIMVHATDVCQCENFTRHEKTFGVTHFYSVEGVPRTGPANVTILNITKHSAFVKWTEIAAEDCLGFLQGYRITYTDSSRKKSLNKGEFEGFVTGLCFSMLFILVFAPLTCSLALKRTSINFHTPDQEFLACSIPFFHLNIDKELTNWKPVSRSLLQALSDNDTISLYVIEHESKTSLKLDLFTDSGEDSKCDTYQSEEPSNNVDVSLRHEEILEEAVTSEEGTISTTVPLLSDYTSMEFSQKALVGQTVKSPARAGHPHLEMEVSNKPAQTKSQVWFGPQDYLKQSQVVFLPSGPTLMGEANSN